MPHQIPGKAVEQGARLAEPESGQGRIPTERGESDIQIHQATEVKNRTVPVVDFPAVVAGIFHEGTQERIRTLPSHLQKIPIFGRGEGRPPEQNGRSSAFEREVGHHGRDRVRDGVLPFERQGIAQNAQLPHDDTPRQREGDGEQRRKDCEKDGSCRPRSERNHDLSSEKPLPQCRFRYCNTPAKPVP